MPEIPARLEDVRGCQCYDFVAFRLDGDLTQVNRLEDNNDGEMIYSALFKAYEGSEWRCSLTFAEALGLALDLVIDEGGDEEVLGWVIPLSEAVKRFLESVEKRQQRLEKELDERICRARQSKA